MKLWLPVLLVLGSCAAAPPVSRGAEGLQAELATRVTGPPESCVGGTVGAGLVAAERRTLVQRRGATLWVNRLDAACPGFDPFDTLIVESSGGRLCRNDRVRGLEPGLSIPGPACILGDWVPYRQSAG